MRLVAETAGQRHFAQRRVARQHKVARAIKAAPNQIGVRRFTDASLERMGKMGCAETHHLAQILDADDFVKMTFNEPLHAMNLPSCQPSGRGIAVTRGGASFDFDLKEQTSSVDQRLGCYTISLDFIFGGVE